MRRLVAAALVLTGTYAAALWLLSGPGMRSTVARLAVPLWVVSLALTWWATRDVGSTDAAPRRPFLALAALALVVQVPALVAPPLTSTDANRYALDGRVVLDGRDPYAYVPLDDRIAHLRDPSLFPGLSATDRTGVVSAPLPRDLDALNATAAGDPRVAIFMPRWPTPYPPGAQAWFALVAGLTPWDLAVRGLQLAGALLVVGTTLLLGRLLRERGRPPWPALLLAWSPTAVVDLTNAGHVDALAMPLLLLAVMAAGRGDRSGRPVVVGLLLAAAVLVKLTPIAVLPAFAALGTRRLRDAAVLVATTLVVSIAAYLPCVLDSETMPFEALLGYVRGTNPATRSVVLQALLPDTWAGPGVLVVGAALALAVLVRGDPTHPAPGALALLGATILLTTPVQSWYVAALLPLVVLTRRWEWLALGPAGLLAYGSLRDPGRLTAGWLVAAAVVVGSTLWRARRESVRSRR